MIKLNTSLGNFPFDTLCKNQKKLMEYIEREPLSGKS